MRRSKKSKEPEEGPSDAPGVDDDPEDGTDEGSGAGAAVDDISARLAPIEEFRSKSDSWMKETSAQLARISTHVAQDEKRQGKLDDRLAEFEERLQGMLQLTEAISMDQNPFVAAKSNDRAPPGATEGPAKRGEDTNRAAPSPRPRTADDDGNVVVIPADGEGYVGRPAPRSQTHPNDAGAEDAHTDTAPTQQAEPGPEGTDDDSDNDNDNALAFEDPDDNPFFTGPSTLAPAGQEPRAAPTTAPEPKDKPRAPAPGPVAPARPPETRPGSAAPTTTHGRTTDTGADSDDGELGPSAARDAERRLAFLQVAGLLARHLRPMEIDPFLECHAQAGWIDHRDITRIRTLAADLSRNRRDPVQRIDREELHMRTILLVSRITASFERRAPRQLDRLFDDRRKIAQSEWMADQS